MKLIQMNNCPKDSICIFIPYMFRKAFVLKFSHTKVDWNATLTRLNKSVAIINTMFKILDIMSLRYIYINKFGFRIGVFNLNMFFLITKVHKNISKWIKMDWSGLNGPNGMVDRIGTRWTEYDQSGPKRSKLN